MTKEKIRVTSKRDFFDFTEYNVEVEGITFYIQRYIGKDSFELAGIRVDEAKALANLSEAFEILGLATYPELDNVLAVTNEPTLDAWDNTDEVVIKLSERLELGYDYDFDKFMPLGNSFEWEEIISNPTEKPRKGKQPKDSLVEQ